MTTLSAAPTPSSSAVAAFEWLTRTLTTGLDEAQIVVTWIPAPLVAADRVFSLAPASKRIAWIGADGDFFVGAGTTLEVRASGERRFDEINAKVARAYDSLLVHAAPGAEPLDPRFYGGFAFRVGGAQAPPWSPFGDALFVLSRLLYRQVGGHAQIGLAISRDSVRTRQLPPQVHDVLAWRDSLARSRNGHHASAHRQLQVCGSTALREQIQDALTVIASGQLDKIVVADCQQIEIDPPPDPVEVLARLLADSPTATTFAFERPDACFLGASPERLVLRNGRRIVTEALAGSIQLEPHCNVRTLLDSTKDQTEHGFVVREIQSALSPVCSELHFPDAPVLRTLRRVAHLSTPLEGRLYADTHVLDLVQRLHPTPAVGGSPTHEAMAWIRQHEPHPRGWYAGPVGWIDAAGDGDFMVALRSGVLCGTRVLLFAGAGVVSGSTLDKEVAEIDLKLSTFRSALGLRTDER